MPRQLLHRKSFEGRELIERNCDYRNSKIRVFAARFRIIGRIFKCARKNEYTFNESIMQIRANYDG